MCQFFSLTSDGDGNILYFDWEIRKRILSKELDYDADSHTSINHYYGFKGADEDNRNKYEYNPITGVFTIDQINSLDDSDEVKKKVCELNFAKIVPVLRIKSIVHPLNIVASDVTQIDIDNFYKWRSICILTRHSIWVSVRDSVGVSVRDSLRDSLWDSVGISLRDSVGVSVWDSVGDSLWDSARDSVGVSVGNSVWAYISSFFNIKEWKYIDHEPFHNPYQCLIDLWERGFVPSFDGTTWRLHCGKDAHVVKEIQVN